MPARSALLVSTGDLAHRLGAPDLRIVDASWYLPAMARDPEAEYLAGHIPGAVRFDIDAVADTSTPLPHMLPSAEVFAAAVGALGIAEGDDIVVYDGAGLLSAARVWWTFTVFGAKRVRILDGGLPAWRSEGRPLATGPAAAVTPAVFRAAFDEARVADRGRVAAALASHGASVVDARPAERFRGEAAEPRAGMRSGHMPGALSVPSSRVVVGGRLAEAVILRDAFAAVDLHRPIITSCGSGVTAAILWLALESLGVDRASLALYDGSWAEWGSRKDTAVVGGA